MTGLIPKAQLFIKRNSSTILTIVGSAGVILTAITAAKDTPKAIQLIEEAKAEKGEELTKLETVKAAAPAYIPTAIVATSTITCVFGANVLNKRKQGALMSAYALIDNSYKEYRKKVVEILGDETDKLIKNEMVADHISEPDLIVEEDEELFWDFYSMQRFTSTMDKVKNALVTLNEQIRAYGYASLNDYYELLGAEPVEYGNDYGWTLYTRAEEINPVNFDIDTCEMVDSVGNVYPYNIIVMLDEPSADFRY